MCVLSIKVLIRKKSGNLFNYPRMWYVCLCMCVCERMQVHIHVCVFVCIHLISILMVSSSFLSLRFAYTLKFPKST